MSSYIYICTLCLIAGEDIDGDTLIKLVEEQNTADFKEVCPVLKNRVQLQSLLKAGSCAAAMETATSRCSVS